MPFLHSLNNMKDKNEARIAELVEKLAHEEITETEFTELEDSLMKEEEGCMEEEVKVH